MRKPDAYCVFQGDAPVPVDESVDKLRAREYVAAGNSLVSEPRKSIPRRRLPTRDQSLPHLSVRDAQGARRAVRRTEAKRSPQQPDPPEGWRGPRSRKPGMSALGRDTPNRLHRAPQQLRISGPVRHALEILV